MSCNYADGLSPYENKGVLGLPEKFDSIEKFNKKCELLAQMISASKHVVVHTGAGISTSAGIPDFRGPNGVWTLEKKGKRPEISVSFADAKPTKTHMILKKLLESNKVHYIVSQNIDGLHMKSGVPRKYLAELHGNMFTEECNVCKRQFIRSAPVETVGKKCSGVPCGAEFVGGRPCRGKLYDGVLDWEHDLPENDLLMAEWHSSIADLSICLGTTLQIVPSGNIPLETLKYGGQLVICNLQPTKQDNKADLIIHYYVDDVLQKVMDILGLEVPLYNEADSPVLQAESRTLLWSINRRDVLALEKIFKAKCKGVKKKRILVKKRRNSTEVDDEAQNDDRSKLIKLETREELQNGNEISEEINDSIESTNNLQNKPADEVTEVENDAQNDDKSKLTKLETGEVSQNGTEISEEINDSIESTNNLKNEPADEVKDEIRDNVHEVQTHNDTELNNEHSNDIHKNNKTIDINNGTTPLQ